MLSSQRILELTGKGFEVSKSLQDEANIASSGHNLNALKYIQQEAIVLKKIMQALAAVAAHHLMNGDYNIEDE